jgi:hypothetical protein
LTLNRTIFVPIHIAGTATFDRIGVKTRADFVGTAVVRLGIYNNTNHQPSTVQLDAGTISCTSAATTYSITINQTLNEGWYWLAVNMQTAGTTNNFFGSSNLLYSELMTYHTDGDGTRAIYYESGISGAFATAGTLVSDFSAPLIHLRAA